MKTPKSILGLAFISVLALVTPMSAQTLTTPALTNGLPALPSSLQSVVNLIPTINLSDTNLANTTLELRAGTSSAPNPNVSGIFTDVQLTYNLQTSWTLTADVVSGNIGGILDSFNADVGYRKILGNFEINPFVGPGYSLSQHSLQINPGVLFEIYPSTTTRFGIYGSVEYDFFLTGILKGKSTGTVKGGASFMF
jgi:hypothetical protein